MQKNRLRQWGPSPYSQGVKNICLILLHEDEDFLEVNISQLQQVQWFDITKGKRMSSNRSWTTGFCTTERQPRNTMNFRLKSTTFASFYFLDGAVTKVPVIPARLPDFHDSLIFLLFILLNWFTLRQNLRKRIQNDLPWFKVIDMCVCVCLCLLFRCIFGNPSTSI